MIQTKHITAFFIVLALLLTVFVVYLLLFKSDAPPDGVTDAEEAVFEEGEEEYDVVTTEPEDKEAAREELRRKLAESEDSGGGSSVQIDPELDAEDDPQEPATTTDTASGALPSFSIQVAGNSVSGAKGSYCWQGICEVAMITDLPGVAHAVPASGKIPFTINATTEPSEIHIFLRDINGTSSPTSRKLSPAEYGAREITAHPVPGTYLLLITGVWPGGQDVSNAFKIRIE